MSDLTNDNQTIYTPPGIIEALGEAWQLVSGLKLPVFITILFITSSFVLLRFLPEQLFWPTLFLKYAILSCGIATLTVLGMNQALEKPTNLDEAIAQSMQVKKELFILFYFIFTNWIG